MSDPPAERRAPPRRRPGHDPWEALRFRDCRLLLSGSLISNIGIQMQMTAIEWEVYDRTGSALALAWIGLAQVLPVIMLSLPAGHVADHCERRRVIMWTQLAIGLCGLGLAAFSAGGMHVGLACGLLLVIGCARAFMHPARAALITHLVPREIFSNAVTWSSGAYHTALVVGPSVGGALIAALGRPAPVYVLGAGASGVYLLLLAMMRPRPVAASGRSVTLASLAAGIAFLRRRPVILGAMSLDLFAVLFGGAVFLLPIYARDILQVGPQGLGWLRAAPAVGSIVMSLLIAWRPPIEKAGRAMLWAVAGFGAATVVFGFSKSYPLSLAMLFLTGFLDSISVVVRHTLVQMLTPDDMRGRVSAINSMFIGASNELGGFESGLVAHLAGPVFSVVSGGVAAVVVVVIVAVWCPQLRRFGSLSKL